MTSSWQCRLELVTRGFRLIFGGEYNTRRTGFFFQLNNPVHGVKWRKTLTSDWTQLEAELLINLWWIRSNLLQKWPHRFVSLLAMLSDLGYCWTRAVSVLGSGP
jgi:hypothetical protein